MNKTKKISKKKIIVQLIVVLIILASVMSLVFSLADYKDIKETFSNLKYGTYLLTLGIVVLSLFFSALSSYLIIKSQKTKVPNRFSFYLNNSEAFFNGITPFGSGSQPFQAYYYMKYGADGEDTTSSLLLNLIVYQFVSLVISTISIFIFYELLKARLGTKMIIVWVGWALNTSFIMTMLLTVYVKSFYKLLILFLKLLSKIKPLRNIMEKKIKETPNFVDNYQKTIKRLIKDPKLLFPVVATKAISVVLYGAITYFVLISMGVKTKYGDFGYLFATTLVSVVLMAWVPLPGASGGTEATFLLLMSDLTLKSGETISASKAAAIMILWRSTTYYFSIIYGAFFAFLLGIYNKKHSNKNNLFTKNAFERLKENKPVRIAYFTDFIENNIYNQIKNKVRKNAIIDIYSNKKIDDLNVTFLKRSSSKLNKINFIKEINVLLDTKKISKNSYYDLIISDTTLYYGEVARRINETNLIPFIFLHRKRNSSSKINKFFDSKREIYFMNYADLVLFKNEDEKNEFIKNNSSYKLKNHLYYEELDKLSISKIEEKIDENTVLGKLKKDYLRGTNKNILVLGGLNSVGFEICNYFLDSNNMVVIIDNKNIKDNISADFYLYKKEVSHKLLNKIFKKFKIDLVIDCYLDNYTYLDILIKSMNDNKVNNLIYNYGNTCDKINLIKENNLINNHFKYILIKHYDVCGVNKEIFNIDENNIIYELNNYYIERKFANISLENNKQSYNFIDLADISKVNGKAYLDIFNHKEKSTEVDLFTNLNYSLKEIIEKIEKYHNVNFEILNIENNKKITVQKDKVNYICNYDIEKIIEESYLYQKENKIL